MAANIYTLLIEEHTADFQRRLTTLSLGEYIDVEMKKLKRIDTELNSLERKKLETQAKYHSDLKVLDALIIETQKSCKHRITRREGDPSGGNDSFIECDHCGKHL